MISFENISYRVYRKLRSIVLREKSAYLSSPYFIKHTELNRNCGKNEIALRPGLKLNISPGSRLGFEYFCFRDEDPIKEFDCFLEIAARKERLLDIGALHGIFSLSFTINRPGAKALAIDPSPIAFPRLLENIFLNPSCNIKARRHALSDKDQFFDMHFEWEHLVVNAISAGKYSKSVTIEALTGDEVCAEEKFIPDLIKIDVEGYEWQCLAGLRHTIDKYRPVVLLEVHPAMLLNFGKFPADLVDFFKTYGYRFSDSAKAYLSEQEVRNFTVIRRIVAEPANASLSSRKVI